jgi:hypothetical protein
MIETIDRDFTHLGKKQYAWRAKLRALNLSRQEASHPKTNTKRPKTIKLRAEGP